MDEGTEDTLADTSSDCIFVARDSKTYKKSFMSQECKTMLDGFVCEQPARMLEGDVDCGPFWTYYKSIT